MTAVHFDPISGDYYFLPSVKIPEETLTSFSPEQVILSQTGIMSKDFYSGFWKMEDPIIMRILTEIFYSKLYNFPDKIFFITMFFYLKVFGKTEILIQKVKMWNDKYPEKKITIRKLKSMKTEEVVVFCDSI